MSPSPKPLAPLSSAHLKRLASILDSSGIAPTETAPTFLHHNIQARLARMEQERQLSNMILGVNPGDSSLGLGGSERTGGTRGLAGSLLSSEMLSILSQARQNSGRG